MFVLNCSVMKDEVVKYQAKEIKKRKKTVPLEEDGIYNPVRCEKCNTEVAVFDQNEIFHFFNVISSNA